MVHYIVHHIVHHVVHYTVHYMVHSMVHRRSVYVEVTTQVLQVTLYTTVLQVMTPTPLGDRLESFPLDEEQSDVSGRHLHLKTTALHTR